MSRTSSVLGSASPDGWLWTSTTARQEQLAARVGTFGSRGGEIERGIVDTPISRLRALAIVIGHPLSAIFRHAELAGDPAAVEEVRASVREAIRRPHRDDLDLVAAIVRRLLTTRA